MNDRFFAFGCSFTNWNYPTWADFIGINFKEYRNIGRTGGSNLHMLEKLVEIDNRFGLDQNDTVYIMLTGVFRFSYCDNNENWNYDGDLINYVAKNNRTPMRNFIKDIYNETFAVHQTWTAVLAMKSILESKKVKHKILMGIDNSHYLQRNSHEHGRDLTNSIKSINKMKQVYEICDLDTSLESWLIEHKIYQEVAIQYKDGTVDGHPNYTSQFRFIERNFPEYYTDASKKLQQVTTQECQFLNQRQQARDWDKIRRRFKKMDTENGNTL